MRNRELSATAARTLHWLRKLCARLPGTSEAVAWGNPVFKANRITFAAVDHYRGADCIWFKAGTSDRERLLARPHFFPSPYDPRKQALCRDLERVNWRELRGLIEKAYRSTRPTGVRRKSTGRA